MSLAQAVVNESSKSRIALLLFLATLSESDERLNQTDSIDPRTGLSTGICGEQFTPEQRATCAALNRKRASSICETGDEALSAGTLPADVWQGRLREVIESKETRLVHLGAIGVYVTEEGEFRGKSFLEKLPFGAEACPFRDIENGVVYKLFNLREHGSLGKKIVFERDEDGILQPTYSEASLQDTLEKIIVLNEVGALPTEIVGLSYGYEALIVKQPLAFPRGDFHEDRRAAIKAIRGVVPHQGGFRHTAAVVFLEGKSWLVSDLHEFNIMRSFNEEPTVIDALIGEVTPEVRAHHSWLVAAEIQAQKFRELGREPGGLLQIPESDDEL